MYLADDLQNCKTCGSFLWIRSCSNYCAVCETKICQSCRVLCSKCHLIVCVNCLLILDKKGEPLYQCFSCLQEAEICQMCGLAHAEITEELADVLTIARTLCTSCALWQSQAFKREEKNDQSRRIRNT